MSGIKINIQKSEFYCFWDVINKKDLYLEIFTCPTKSLPMKYLGVPIGHKKLSVSQWMQTKEKFEEKLGVWHGRF
jgi:hypothetical protein